MSVFVMFPKLLTEKTLLCALKSVSERLKRQNNNIVQEVSYDQMNRLSFDVSNKGGPLAQQGSDMDSLFAFVEPANNVEVKTREEGDLVIVDCMFIEGNVASDVSVAIDKVVQTVFDQCSTGALVQGFTADEGSFSVTMKSVQQPVKEHVEPVKTTTEDDCKEKLLLIDGSNLLAKGYFATSWRGDLKPNSNGLYTNGVYVFMKSLFRLIRQYEPTHVITCWDRDSKKTFRKQMYPEYKAGRESDEELKQQFPLCETLLHAMNVPYFSHETWEADDYIGTLATQWKKHHDGEVLIASSDKDLFQLLDDRTHQLFKRQGEDESMFTAADFQKQYGIATSQWLTAKAILGDKSDNIPGIKGVGEKFLPALADYKIFHIEDLYNDEVIEALKESPYKRYVNKIEGSKEVAELSYELSKIVCDIEGCQVDFNDLVLNVNKEAMEVQLEELELTKLIGEF
ncbi:5'-3' exonuclease [Desertibacillus haloalkaliphilus]|uniref:5'-3' exonuclease n=1 Tax=Desertibacillus haloalkaliphilus TaxID=1328930 RepID=UPI001C263502|nr:5'-3' exonuclease H3TH domain-containing protein [Desertibacillus haloalkaliphilus]MBU8908162.1 hypothetical protein [Desertibacillus haloalkaliphilus]